MIDVLLHTKMSPPGGLENPGPNTLGLPAFDDEKLKRIIKLFEFKLILPLCQ